jgi:hypothetical protein
MIMSDVLGKYALQWLCLLNTHGLYRQPRENNFTQDIEVAIQCYEAQYYVNRINTKTMRAVDIVNSLPPWFVFTLPRRPATVIFATWQDLMRKNDREGYSSYFSEHKKLFTRFIRDQLFLYKLSRAFRQVMDLPTFSMKDGSLSLPDHQRSILLGFATPSGILQRVAQFAVDRPIQIGISYVRSIEKLSSAISNASSAEDVEQAIIEFSQSSKHLQAIEVEYQQLQIEPSEYTDQNISEVIDTVSIEDIPLQFGRNPRKLITMDQVKSEKKLQLMEAYRDFPIWFRIKQYLLQADESHKYPFMEYFLCKANQRFIIASRVKKAGDREWRQYSSFFEYFDSYPSALSRLDQLLREKQVEGYQITNEAS